MCKIDEILIEKQNLCKEIKYKSDINEKLNQYEKDYYFLLLLSKKIKSGYLLSLLNGIFNLFTISWLKYLSFCTVSPMWTIVGLDVLVNMISSTMNLEIILWSPREYSRFLLVKDSSLNGGTILIEIKDKSLICFCLAITV